MREKVTGARRVGWILVALFAAVASVSTVLALMQSSRLGAERRDNAPLESKTEKPEEGPTATGEGLLGSLSGSLGGGVLQCLTADTTAGDGIEKVPGGGTGSKNAQVRAIARAVEQVRDLDFKKRVRPTFLSSEKVAQRAARLILEDYPTEVAEAEARLLSALGAIPADLDLRATVRDLLETQVAGFYLPDTGELVVPSDDRSRPLTAAEKIVLAHELEHALAHQNLEFSLPDAPDPARLDEDLAALALIEGDATLSMQRYALSAIPIFEQLSMLSDPLLTGAQAALEGMPHYLVRQLEFPYVAGLEFTCDRYDAGKWKAVDRAYAHPPASTDQVLFPDRYGEDARRPPGAPRPPGARWKRVWSSSFGAAQLMWLFEAPGGDASAALSSVKDRVAAWGGGRIIVWRDGERTALGLALAERAGEDGLCAAVADWYEAAFSADAEAVPGEDEHLVRDGSSQDAVLRCRGDDVRLGIGPDIATARRITR